MKSHVISDIPPYLQEYLKDIVRKVGKPLLLNKLPNEAKKWQEVNVIYKVADGVFIHILKAKQAGEPRYIVIEPPRPNIKLLKAVEYAVALSICEKEVPEDLEERRKLLCKLLDKVCIISDTKVNYEKLKIGSFKVKVFRRDYEYLKYHFLRDKIGLGILEPLINDPYLEDISCPGLEYFYVVHKYFGSLKTNIRFKDEEELNRFVATLSERVGKPISHAKPIVDATLPDGSRINIVFGSDVSLRGSNFTIRKVSKIPISITQLISWGTLDPLIAAYLWLMINEGMSVFICGETASGKTTTLNAISVFIRPDAKVVTIEDTAEVVIPHENWVRELTRDTGSEDSSVTMFDLLKAALRQRPNYIIVGEIRGAEGNIAFQAMQTGHPVMATFHAASVERMIQRLTSQPIEVPKTHIDNLNIAVFQSAVRSKAGMLLRRVITVNEIIGYDPESDGIIYMPIFVWDPKHDKFRFSGFGSSYLLNEKVALRRGFSHGELKKIYDELNLRARFLELLVANGIFDYFNVWRAIVRTYEIGLEESVRLLEREGKL